MEKEITGEMLLSRNIREIPTLLDPLLPKSGLVCLAGSSDTGKSAFLRQLSMSVSAGSKTFLGMRLNVVHHSAIYVSTEDDEIANAYLVARQNMDMKLSPHCGKRTEMFMPSKHNLLGSQAFEAKMRLVLELRSDISDVTYKHLCCVKGNYLSAEYKSESIKLHFSEHLTFKETGERVPFENLLPVDTSKEAKYQLARQLKEEGQTYEQIAKKLGYKDKSSVTKLIQSYENKKQKQNG